MSDVVTSFAVTAGDIGTAQGKAVTALSIPITGGGVPAGALIVVHVTNNLNAGAPSAPIDDAGNTYIRAIWNNNVNGPLTNAVFYCYNSKALTAGQTISFSGGPSASWAAQAFYATGIATATDPYVNSIGTSGSSATPTATLGSQITGNFCYGGLAVNGPSGDTYTNDSAHGWNTPPPTKMGTTGGSAASNMTVFGSQQINADATSKIYSPTISSSRQWLDTIVQFSAAPAGPPVGTLNLTQGNNTLSGGGWSQAHGDLNSTQASNSLTASGWSTATGTLNVAQANQSLSGQARVAVAGTLGVTQANQTISATGGAPPAIGTLNVTESTDSLTAAGAVRVAGTLGAAQANQTISATGALTVVGTLGTTQASQTLVGAGGVLVAGGLTALQTNQTIAATGGPIAGGTLVATQASQTLVGSGGLIIGGGLGVTQANQTLGASGSVTVASVLNVIQDSQILVGNARAVVGGTLSTSQQNQTISASGTAQQPAGSFAQARVLVLA